MARDAARIASLQDALRTAEVDALVCSLPANVLLASGYWPVVGPSADVGAGAGPFAGNACLQGATQLREGLTETEAAALFRVPLGAGGTAEGVGRAGGFAYCMSGPNAAQAHGAYARSRGRRLGAGDLVLVHCN